MSNSANVFFCCCFFSYPCSGKMELGFLIQERMSNGKFSLISLGICNTPAK